MVANAKISLSPQVQLKKHAVLPHSIQAKLDSHNNKNQVSFPLHYFLSLHNNINNPTIFYNLISILFYKKITSPPNPTCYNPWLQPASEPYALYFPSTKPLQNNTSRLLTARLDSP